MPLRLSSLLCVLLLHCHDSMAENAASDQSEIAQKTALVVGFENVQYLPLFGHSDDRMVGFMGDLLEAFENHSDIRFQYEPLPINRLYRLLFDEQRIAFKFPDNPTWVANELTNQDVHYSIPVLAYANVLVSRNDRPLSPHFVSILGSIRGITPAELIANAQFLVSEVLYFSGPDDMLKALVQGRIEAAYIEINVARYMLNKMNIGSQVQFNCNAPIVVGYYHLSTINQSVELQQFNLFMAEHKLLVGQLRSQYDWPEVLEFPKCENEN